MISLRDVLLQEEGLSLVPYICTGGHRTVGIGHNMDAHPLPAKIQSLVDQGLPITEEMAFALLEEDERRVMNEVDQFSWFYLLSHNRQVVVLAMVFQFGLGGFKKFKKMIDALKVGDHDLAAVEMLNSKWAKEDSPDRAKRMAKLMREG